MPALNVWIYVTKAVTVEKANIMTPGKPDFHAVMDTVVTECPNKSVQVFACGPEQSTPPCSLIRLLSFMRFSFVLFVCALLLESSSCCSLFMCVCVLQW